MYHESFGEVESVTFYTLRRYKVTPAEYDELVGVYGTDEASIRAAVAEYSPKGWYNSYLMLTDRLC